jgi:hypothetical protein
MKKKPPTNSADPLNVYMVKPDMGAPDLINITANYARVEDSRILKFYRSGVIAEFAHWHYYRFVNKETPAKKTRKRK